MRPISLPQLAQLQQSEKGAVPVSTSPLHCTQTMHGHACPLAAASATNGSVNLGVSTCTTKTNEAARSLTCTDFQCHRGTVHQQPALCTSHLANGNLCIRASRCNLSNAAGSHDEMLCSCRIWCCHLSEWQRSHQGAAQAARAEQDAKHVVASLKAQEELQSFQMQRPAVK